MFWSHPGKALKLHLLETIQYSTKYAGNQYHVIMTILAACHDFGKYTTYFQNYLKGKIGRSDDTNHSFISALLVAYIIKRKKLDEPFIELFSYHIILCHHGSEHNLDNNLPMRKNSYNNSIGTLSCKMESVVKQRDDMRNHMDEICADYNVFGLGHEVREFLELENYNCLLDELKDLYNEFLNSVEDEQWDRKEDKKPSDLIRYYYEIQCLYSSLIAADKLSASNTKEPMEKRISTKILLESKRNALKAFSVCEDRLNLVRNDIFDNVMKGIEDKLDRKNGLYSITAPTGTGKTFCGFFAASKLRDLLGDNRKIIYALPFTSIIDQNYDVIAKLFESSSDDFSKNQSHYMMKHHCLSNVEYTSVLTKPPIAQAELMLENWSAPFIVTTFVQLLETLVSNRNRMLKKFHAIQHSIIVMDEVQAIPLELLPVCDYVLDMATKLLDVKIITMTATKPILLKESVELLDDYDSYFKEMKRTQLIFQEQKRTIEEFAQDFIEEKEDKSYLIILNTINSSLELFEKLKGLDYVYYLSTNLLPIHRKQRIQEITQLLRDGKPVVLVSTQAVEAGVDFDFQHVYRDLAPIDSIIQAAGRENRHQRRHRETVTVINLVNSQNRSFGEMVYGKTQIHISKTLLEKYNNIEEEQYLTLIKEYFDMATEYLNHDKSDAFINGLERVYFEDNMEHFDKIAPISKFSLIEEKSGYMDVFLRINDEAERVYQTFVKAMKEKDIALRHEQVLKIRANMALYTLSIPQTFLKRFNYEKGDFIISLPEEGCEDYYSEETGFKRSEEEDFFIL